MKKLKIGLIGIGHNHGEGKMSAIQKLSEMFEVVGYAEENEEWIKKRGSLPCYKNLQRMSVEQMHDSLKEMIDCIPRDFEFEESDTSKRMDEYLNNLSEGK